MVTSFVDGVIDQIIMSHDWAFACDEATESSVADQHTYVLRGNNGDCRDIINIRYGTGYGKVLEKKNVLAYDRELSSEDTDPTDSSGVITFTEFGRSDDGFPKIRLYNTPQSASTITYRYRKNNLSIGDIPEDFDDVIVNRVLAQFNPEYLIVAERSLRQMMDRYSVGGDEYEKARLDPVIEAGNKRRANDLQGGL